MKNRTDIIKPLDTEPQHPVADPAEPADPESLHAWVPRYLEWLGVQNYAPRTIERAGEELGFFLRFCDERSVTRPEHVSKAVLQAYQRHLFYLRKRDGLPLHSRTQRSRLMTVKMLFTWLSRQNILFFNPAADIQLPREEQTLPRSVLNANEVDTVLDQADVHTLYGLRDRAAMELLYSTAMRRAELVALDVYDIDFERGVVAVRHGKGRKDRFVPLGERAALWLRKYLADGRPRLEVSLAEAEHSLFLSRLGRRITPDHMSAIISKYIKAADLGKKGSAHTFRHTVGTLMLENGAELRHVQELLGHADIKTTQIYTRVAIAKLKQVHAVTHPANIERSEGLLG